MSKWLCNALRTSLRLTPTATAATKTVSLHVNKPFTSPAITNGGLTSKILGRGLHTGNMLHREKLYIRNKPMTLEELDYRLMKNEGLLYKRKKRPSKMYGKPQMKGVVTRLLIRKPKKPNSANRRCCKVRLNHNGKEVIAYIPGEGHTLQEHNVVLLEGGRVQDLIGVHYKVIRGKFDCSHVVKKSG